MNYRTKEVTKKQVKESVKNERRKGGSEEGWKERRKHRNNERIKGGNKETRKEDKYNTIVKL